MAGREIIGKTIDRYRIDKLLGQGGMAAVYEATDTRLERQVAIKIMHPHLATQETFQDRFLVEARLAARLDHPNIVRVLSFDHVDDELFLVMDLIRGGSLRHHIKSLHESARLMGFPEVVELVRQLAEALHYAHQQNMVHRDMKPDNVLLKPSNQASGGLDYQPIVTDFGLAKLTASDEEAATAEQPIGTYPYMSPEQCRAVAVDGRTDIYSIGIMLYELAVGRLPFQPKSIAEANRMHNEEQPPAPATVRPGFPATLERIIFKCLEKDPSERYQSGRELSTALASLQTTSAQQASAVVSSDPDKTAAMDFVPDGELPIFTVPPLTAQQARYDRLLLFSEAGGSSIVPIRRAVMTIGRDTDQSIQLNHPSVSRRHARLERGVDKLYRLVDLESSNGTWVDGQRLDSHKLVILEPEQVLQIGHYWLVLELKDSAVYSTILDDDDDSSRSSDVIAAPIVDVADMATDRGADSPVVEDEPVEPEPEPQQAMMELRDEPETPPEAEPALPEPKLRRRQSTATVPTVEELNRTQIMQYELQSEIPYFDPPELSEEEKQADRVVVYQEGEAARVFPLMRHEISIGRAAIHPIHLSSNTVSQHHAVILRDDDGQYSITDVGSTNGTWLGDAIIPRDTQMEWDGDEIVRIGDYWLTLEYSEEQAVRARLDAMSTYLGEERGEGDFEMPQPLASISTYDAKLVGQTVGSYKLTEFFGKNSISSVYQARSRNNDEIVALKIIHPYLVQDEFFLRAFFVEAPIAQNLNHPNVVSIINYEQSGDYLYIVMDLVEGPTLRTYLDDVYGTGRNVDLAQMAEFARQISDGMYYVHQQGLFYRDLSPSNIVLSEDIDNAGNTVYTPVLTDFALAEMVQQSDVYVPSVVSGDYTYITPERTLGKKQDERSDVYELGIVMYETLTGKPPYQPRSLAEATRMHTRMALEPPSKLRPETPYNLERIITKALAKRRARPLPECQRFITRFTRGISCLIW
ncbi:MAG: protein kinase [Anaerolineae bacterium]|nr:protein kinase [Anaerolineae bacterium]